MHKKISIDYMFLILSYYVKVTWYYHNYCVS